MQYGEFWLRFGSALRTKYLKLSPAQRLRRWAVENATADQATDKARRVVTSVRKDPRQAFERFTERRTHAARRAVAQGTVGALPAADEESALAPTPPVATKPANRRPFALPNHSGALPAEFIRLDPWEAEYLFSLASRSRLGVVETGRFHGGSTFLLACANPNVPIHSIDIAPKDDRRLEGFMKAEGVGANVNLIVGDSQFGTYPEIGEVDLLFVDGDHSKEGCRADLDNWYSNVVPGGHVVLHDSYFGCPVQDAAIEFVADHDVEAIVPPYIPATHWYAPTGSLAHFVKRS